MTLTPGTRLGHAQVLSPLSAGGMGEVYLAEDTQLKRQVALKLLPSQFTSDADRVRPFEQEAKAASALNHPNIITIYEIRQEQGTHYMATEFIEGNTLRQPMTSGKLTLNAALEIAIQTASALVAAHEAGIVHRDIKPENVMLRRDGDVKVLDFGLAKLIESPEPTIDKEAATLAKAKTEPGTVMGTASDMSPAQARGQAVDARTDIFSLGIMLYELYEMIAGRALMYINTAGGVSNLWRQPLDGRAPKQITDFKSDLIYNFAYSHDGKQLALSRGNTNREVVRISNAK